MLRAPTRSRGTAKRTASSSVTSVIYHPTSDASANPWVGSRPGISLDNLHYLQSVITGAADRRSERVAALVYLDVFLPQNGESCWAMTNDDQRAWYATGCARTGYGVDPLPFFSERARPLSGGDGPAGAAALGGLARRPNQALRRGPVARRIADGTFNPAGRRRSDHHSAPLGRPTQRPCRRAGPSRGPASLPS